jgi:hypothetical protein
MPMVTTVVVLLHKVLEETRQNKEKLTKSHFNDYLPRNVIRSLGSASYKVRFYYGK